MAVEKCYSIIETAEMLGLKVRTVRGWAQKGKIQASKIPGTDRWIVKESEIRRLQGDGEESNN